MRRQLHFSDVGDFVAEQNDGNPDYKMFSSNFKVAIPEMVDKDSFLFFGLQILRYLLNCQRNGAYETNG